MFYSADKAPSYLCCSKSGNTTQICNNTTLKLSNTLFHCSKHREREKENPVRKRSSEQPGEHYHGSSSLYRGERRLQNPPHRARDPNSLSIATAAPRASAGQKKPKNPWQWPGGAFGPGGNDPQTCVGQGQDLMSTKGDKPPTGLFPTSLCISETVRKR